MKKIYIIYLCNDYQGFAFTFEGAYHYVRNKLMEDKHYRNSLKELDEIYDNYVKTGEYQNFYSGDWQIEEGEQVETEGDIK